MAHCTGGGALVFGVNTRFQKSDRNLNSEEIIARITILAHDTQEPPLGVEVHQISTNLGKLLCLHILPPKTRPVFIKDKSPFGGQASPDTNQDIRQIGRPMVAASISPLPAWEWPVLEKDSSYGYMKLNSLAGGRKTCEQQTIFP